MKKLSYLKKMYIWILICAIIFLVSCKNSNQFIRLESESNKLSKETLEETYKDESKDNELKNKRNKKNQLCHVTISGDTESHGSCDIILDEDGFLEIQCDVFLNENDSVTQFVFESVSDDNYKKLVDKMIKAASVNFVYMDQDDIIAYYNYDERF